LVGVVEFPLLEAVIRERLVKTVTHGEDLVREQGRTSLFNYKARKISKRMVIK
jgi:hypothetical protein